MRILLALDGSPSSDAACQLVESLTWPSGSVVQVVAVAEPAAELLAPLVVSAPTMGSYDQQTSDGITVRHFDFDRLGEVVRSGGPGRAIGQMIRRKICRREAPSTRPASSNSFGIESK